MENNAKYVQATDSVNLFHKRHGNLNSNRNEINSEKNGIGIIFDVFG